MGNLLYRIDLTEFLENVSYFLLISKFYWYIRDMKHFRGRFNPFGTIKRIFEHWWMSNKDIFVVELITFDADVFIIRVNYLAKMKQKRRLVTLRGYPINFLLCKYSLAKSECFNKLNSTKAFSLFFIYKIFSIFPKFLNKLYITNALIDGLCKPLT